jgi:hypothetical protein
MPHLPNLFLVGAPKAGTTSLARYLAQHPAVYMSPIKEPCFFAPEVVDFEPRAREIFDADAAALGAYLDGPMSEPRDRGIVLDWEQYLKLFKHVRDESAIGEASVSYLGSPGAPSAIHAKIPHARIIMMLRDPADRLFSHYAAARAAGTTAQSFARWLDDQVAVEATRQPPIGPVWAGRYGEHLQRYLASFPVEQVHVSFYEDFIRDARRVVASILTFLGVDPDVKIDLRQRHNVTTVPRWPALVALTRPVGKALRAVAPEAVVNRVRALSLVPQPLTATSEERARAVEIYRGDIRVLERLLGRNLSTWQS